MALEFAFRFPCVTITPLGAEVLPEVNCRNARSSSAGCDGGSMSGTSARSSEVKMTRSRVVTLPTADQSTLPTRSLVTSALGCATLRMPTSASMKASSFPSETGG